MTILEFFELVDLKEEGFSAQNFAKLPGEGNSACNGGKN